LPPDDHPPAEVAELLASLRLSEARLRGVLNSISDGFYAVDRNWKLTEFNAAAEKYFRMSREQLIGRDYWNLVANANDAFKALLRAAMDGAPMAVLETRSLYRPDRFVELRIASTEEGLCVALTDITDRRLTQDRLEKMVAERTAELRASEEALRQAQKLEAVGQLTGGIAHDFNNLLMVISGGLNMLERAPERREMLMGRMREAVERGANLTKQLLAFSRRQTLSPKAIALPDYFAGMSDLLGRSLGVNVRVAIDVPPDLAPVFADPNALQLALLNLAVNARDAMNDSGVVTIQARDGAFDDPGAVCVSISVSDTGSGMTPDVLERIFEPFFTTKDIGKGSGLGLAQVHGFAEQSGGRVDVLSRLGEGTRVTLVLPRADERAVLAAEQQTLARPQAIEAVGNALLVEDDDDVAALTGEMLSHLGWRVTRVASAEAALNARIDDVGLVFSDVMMPGGKNGIELAQTLRARRPALPIVLASGYAESVRVEAARLNLPLLSKPFDIDALAATIEAVTRS
jgi:PAS domain S-box-containing protein